VRCSSCLADDAVSKRGVQAGAGAASEPPRKRSASRSGSPPSTPRADRDAGAASPEWTGRQAGPAQAAVESDSGVPPSAAAPQGGAILEVFTRTSPMSGALDPAAAPPPCGDALSAGTLGRSHHGKGALLILHYPFSKDVFARRRCSLEGIASASPRSAWWTGSRVVTPAAASGAPEGRALAPCRTGRSTRALTAIPSARASSPTDRTRLRRPPTPGADTGGASDPPAPRRGLCGRRGGAARGGRGDRGLIIGSLLHGALLAGS